MRIHILPPSLANQIAAGEVIERPASVVKELLENSLDANASSIEIIIEKGGSQLISVRDNGFGIHSEDLTLALTRHGTSKIHDLSDLENILSLGFRGEALASIAAVSRLSLISCTDGRNSGFRIDAEGSNIFKDIKPCAHPTGTSIQIHDLFYNTPARRKFLRSEKTEFNYIEEMVKKIALSRFDLRIQLTHNDRKILNVNSATTDPASNQRIVKIIGDDFINNAVKIDFEVEGLRLWGWLSLPSFSIAQSNQQFFYINGRIIRDKVIMHAIKQAYNDAIANNRQPVFVLFLEINPSQIDVNVHPMKHEVRFRESRLIHDFILHAISKSISTKTQIFTDILTSENSNVNYNQQKNFNLTSSPKKYVNEPWLVYETEKITQDKILAADSKLFGKAIAIIQNRFILAEKPDAFLILNVHAAQAFLLKQVFLKAQRENAVVTKPLLFPENIIVTIEQFSIINTLLVFLNKMGFELASMGEKQFILRQAPSILAEITFSELLTELADQFLKMKNAKKINFEEFISSFVIIAAKYKTLPEKRINPSQFFLELENHCENTSIKDINFCHQLSFSECEKLIRTGKV